MSSNTLGTVFRITMIAFLLIGYWVISVGIVYFLASYLIGIEVSLKIFGLLLIGVMIFRMFYPKNVFN
jgi:hypothetical protein